MAENSNRRGGPENGSAADADATSDATDEEFGRSERGTGTSQGARADTTGSTLTDAEGKTVVDHEGNTVGLVDEVEGETLYIEPDPGSPTVFRRPSAGPAATTGTGGSKPTGSIP